MRTNNKTTWSGEAGKWNMICLISLVLMLFSPTFYRASLYNLESLTDILLVLLGCMPLALLLTSIKRWWIYFILTTALMYFAGNETITIT